MALEGISTEALMRKGVASQTIKDILIPIVISEKEKLLQRLAQAVSQEDLLLAKAEARTILALQRQLDTNIRQGLRED